MGKSITCTIIFRAQSLNYGEGIGNISELKKLTRGNGNVYSMESRQAIAYDIRRLGAEFFNWNLQTVDKAQGTIQFKSEYTIEDSVEMDLFGFMKTIKKGEKNKGGAAIRSGVVRLSNAISLEPYKGDMDFLNNKGFADRIGEHPNLANSEQHLSFYTYTVTIDLDRIGVDGDINLKASEKAKRVNQLLDIVKVLNRNIRGRQENLSPLFIIGGIYDIANPFFLGRIKLDYKNNGYLIDENILRETLNLSILDCNIKENTKIGIVSNVFLNDNEIKSLVKSKTIEEFFKEIKHEVNVYYGVES